VRVPNLASTALGLAARQRTDDWQDKYPYRPVLMETCVDTARFPGSAYKAAGWECIGSTQPRTNTSRKDVYWKPLTTDFKPILRTMRRTPAPKSARDDLRRGAEIDEAITRPCRLVQTLITAATRVATDYDARWPSRCTFSRTGDHPPADPALRLSPRPIT